MSKHSDIIEFYYGHKDINGRTWDEIMRWGLMRLERTHDYIQWLFPNKMPSNFNPDAPLLSQEDIWMFNEDPDLKLRVSLSLEKMKDFYFNSTHWLNKNNHNYLRITRILKFLNDIKMYAHQDLMIEYLDSIYKEYNDVIGEKTYKIWRNTR